MASDFFNKAIVLVKTGDKEAAGRILRRITVENPQHVMAWMWLLETIPDVEDRVGVLKECLLYNPQNPQAAGAMAYFQSLLETQTAAGLQIAFSPEDPQPGAESAPEANANSFADEIQGPFLPFSEHVYASGKEPSKEAAPPISPVKESSHFQPFFEGTMDEKNADFLAGVKDHEPALAAQSKAPVGAAASVPDAPVDEEDPRVQQKFLNIWVILSIVFVILLLFLAYLRFQVVW